MNSARLADTKCYNICIGCRVLVASMANWLGTRHRTFPDDFGLFRDQCE